MNNMPSRAFPCRKHVCGTFACTQMMITLLCLHFMTNLMWSEVSLGESSGCSMSFSHVISVGSVSHILTLNGLLYSTWWIISQHGDLEGAHTTPPPVVPRGPLVTAAPGHCKKFLWLSQLWQRCAYGHPRVISAGNLLECRPFMMWCSFCCIARWIRHR